MRKGNRKKRKGHDCSWVWWRKKFTVEMWESLVKGKDIWIIPQWT